MILVIMFLVYFNHLFLLYKVLFYAKIKIMEHFPISEIQASGSVQLYESEDLGDVDDGLVRS